MRNLLLLFILSLNICTATAQPIIIEHPSQLNFLSNMDSGEIIIKDGLYEYSTETTWKFQRALGKTGDIIIRPETPGGVVFKNRCYWVLNGDNIIYRDFVFEDVDLLDDKVGLKISGSGILVFNNYFHKCGGNHEGTSNRNFIKVVDSDYSTISHNTFDNMVSRSIRVSISSSFTTIEANYFHDTHTAAKANKKPETIQLNWRREGSSNLVNSVIQNNLFENEVGDVETISVKCSGNVIKNNSFEGCRTITLRHGSSNKVYGNRFKNGGGIRIYGSDHEIFNNLIFNHPNLEIDGKGDDGIEIGSGNDPEKTKDTTDEIEYQPAHNAFVANNTIINPFKHGINISARKDTDESDISITPNGVILSNNLVYNLYRKQVWPYYNAPNPKANPSGYNNKFFMRGYDFDEDLDSTKFNGFLDQIESLLGSENEFSHIEDSQYPFIAESGFLPPNSTLIDAGFNDWSSENLTPPEFIGYDIEGQPRDNFYDIGADEISNSPIINIEITKDDVGHSFGHLVMEAESAYLGSKWEILSESEASAGEFVALKTGTSKDEVPVGKQNKLSFTFEIRESGDYEIWARVIASSPGTDSYWVRDFSGVWQGWYLDPTVYSEGWQWIKVHPVTGSTLEEGIHELVFSYRESGAKMDKIYLHKIGQLPDFLNHYSSPVTYAKIIEAEHGFIGDRFELGFDNSEEPFVTPLAGDQNKTMVSGSCSDVISYDFYISKSGKYTIYGKVLTESAGGDSFWVNVDDTNWKNWNSITTGTDFTWVPIFDNDNQNATLHYNLTAGWHTLNLSHRENGIKLDKLLITDAITSYHYNLYEEYSSYPVVWNDLVNVDVCASELIKIDFDESWVSGASSYNIIPGSEDGWVQMEVSDQESYIGFGLSNGNAGEDWASIEHNFYLRGGDLHIIQSGTNISNLNTQYTTGDLIRIERVGNNINFLKNGISLYSVITDYTEPLLLDVSLYHTSSSSQIINAICSHTVADWSAVNARKGKVGNKNIKNVHKVYPNPSSDYLNIEIYTSKVVGLTDIAGKIYPLVITENVTGNVVLDVSHLKAGVYFVYFSDNKSVKFIKN